MMMGDNFVRLDVIFVFSGCGNEGDYLILIPVTLNIVFEGLIFPL